MQDMDQGAKGWLLRTAHRNFWRVCAYYELEDLIQDGYLHYARIVNRYPHIKDPPHIMRMFQVTFVNHLNDISKKKTRQLDVSVSTVVTDDQTVTEFFERNGGQETELCDLMLAPLQVRTALKALGADKAAKVLHSKYRKHPDGTRETTNQKLCRIAGLDAELFSLHSVLKSYLATV